MNNTFWKIFMKRNSVFYWSSEYDNFTKKGDLPSVLSEYDINDRLFR